MLPRIDSGLAMNATLTNLLAVLDGTSPAPLSNFLSLSGRLDLQEIHSLSTALTHSSFAGGLRLKGEYILNEALHMTVIDRQGLLRLLAP